MNISVSAAALRTSGALTIYKQFIKHLSTFVNGHKYFIFISDGMPSPEIKGVTYIISDCHSGFGRIWFDAFGLKHFFQKRGIKLDYVISLQNTTINVAKYCKSILYYHQSIPFYPQKWNFLKREESRLFLYKYFYPIFVKAFLRKETKVIVQIPFIKRGFVNYFHHPGENVEVLFPDVEKIDVQQIEPLFVEKDYVHLIYPATAFSYKNHKVLFDAIGIIVKTFPTEAKKIKLHITISREDCPKHIHEKIICNEITNNVSFDGVIPHKDLLRLYKAADALVFSSTVETLGLPLIEAASFGIPVFASNLDYAREVLDQYEGVTFISPYDPNAWANAILELIRHRGKHYRPLEPQTKSTWEEFFNLIYTT